MCKVGFRRKQIPHIITISINSKYYYCHYFHYLYLMRYQNYSSYYKWYKIEVTFHVTKAMNSSLSIVLKIYETNVSALYFEELKLYYSA